MESIASRFLPIGTEAMAQLIHDPNNANKLYQKLIGALEKEGVRVTITETEFVKILLESILNNDVPYFSQFGNSLYYGHVSEGKIVGIFNTNQQIGGIQV